MKSYMWQESTEQKAPLLKKGTSTQSEQEFGQKYEYDPTFKGVREDKRTCNDILFAALFLLVISAMIAIAAVGFSKGNPSTLIPTNEYSGEIENKAEYWFQDSVAIMKRDADVLGAGLAFAFVLAVLWIQLMRSFTKLFIYLTLTIGLAGIIAAGVFFLHLGMQRDSSSLKITSYSIFGLAAILVIIVFFLRKKIALTSALFAECCKGFQHNPTILIVGTIVFLMLAAFSVFWVVQFIYLYSIPGDSVAIPNAPSQYNQKIRNLMYFQTFAYFWVAAFLSGVFQVAVAGGMATWYFSRDVDGYKANVGSPAIRSFARALTKSFGSIALGSLLLATVQFINFMLTVCKKANFKNRVLVYIISCIQCFVSCLVRIVQFVDRFSYIYIAMHGQSFCASAKGVFNLIERNAFSAVVVDVLGEVILFIGKLLGTAATTMFTVGIISHLGRPISVVTVAITAVVSFRVFSLFAKIVHVGVDTVMVCYLEDMERNKEGALYMSPDLHGLLQNKVAENRRANTVNN